MAILKVARLGHPILRKVAEAIPLNDIPSDNTQRLIKDMVETMREYNGLGLAAPQVHVSKKLLIFESKENPRYPNSEKIPLTIMINPEINILDQKKIKYWEGCLSVPDLKGEVERPSKVQLKYYDEYAQYHDVTLTGLSAIVVQHEYDHLIGKVFLDRMINFDNLSFLTEYQKYHIK